MSIFFIFLFFSTCILFRLANADKDDNKRSISPCRSVSVGVNYALRSDCSYTTYCYNFTTSNTEVSWWRVSSSSPFLAYFPTSFGLGTTSPGSVTSLTGPGKYVQNLTQCFLVPRKSLPIDGKITINLGSRQCVANIKVPSQSKDCKCVLDSSPLNIKIGSCDATCNSKNGTAVGTRTNTRNVLTPGGNCTSTFEERCTSVCPIDCQMTMEPDIPCPSLNCGTTTQTITRFYTTRVAAQNGGRECMTSSAITKECVPKPCPTDCVVDLDPLNGCCENGCRGNCSSNLPLVPGTKTCQYKTLTEPGHCGKKCSLSQTTVSCTKICPVNCVMNYPDLDSLPCTPDCISVTRTETAYATVIQKGLNGGTPCPANLLFGVKICSIPASAVVSSCGLNCVVDGIPENKCSSLCARQPTPTTSFFAKATFPITLKYQQFTGSACPTFTNLCDCNDCILYPTPASVGVCEVTCTQYDGSYATGVRSVVYSVSRSQASGRICKTLSLIPCQKYCSCKYDTTITDRCIPTSTYTLTTPWVVSGVIQITPIGSIRSCNKIFTKTCTNVLGPTACKFQKDIPTFSCPFIIGADSVLRTIQTQTNIVTQKPNNGGSECPSSIVFKTVSTTCPGCEYTIKPICSCLYTESQTGIDILTSYSGYTRCSYPVLNRPTNTIPFTSATNPPNSLCMESIVHQFDQACATTLKSTACDYATKGCDRCLITTSILANALYVGSGYHYCTKTDVRGNSAICTPKVTKTGCLLNIQPTNCISTKVCLTAEMSCFANTASNKTFTKRCEVRTLSTAAFGGSKCSTDSSATATETETYVLKCQSTNSVGGTTNGFDAKLTSAIIFGDLVLFGTKIEGRLYVGGNATMLDVLVGKKIESQFATCDTTYPVLYAKNNLLMSGHVYGGPVIANLLCTVNIDSQCPVLCKNRHDILSYNDVCKLEVDLNSIYKFLQKTYAPDPTRIPNANLTSHIPGTVKVNWAKNTENHFLQIDAASSNPILPWNAYNRWISKTSNVQIDVYGTEVSIHSFSLEYFKYYGAGIIWNFVEAKKLTINDIKIYGVVIALNAEVIGNGVIVGALYAKSHIGTPSSSITVIMDHGSNMRKNRN